MMRKHQVTLADLRRLRITMTDNLDQLIVRSAVSLKLTQKEIRALEARVKRLERLARLKK